MPVRTISAAEKRRECGTDAPRANLRGGRENTVHYRRPVWGGKVALLPASDFSQFGATVAMGYGVRKVEKICAVTPAVRGAEAFVIPTPGRDVPVTRYPCACPSFAGSASGR